MLKLDEKVLGPEHPDSLDTRNNLALALLHQRNYTEAETEDRQLFKLQERVLGLEHPNTLDTRNNLAKALAREASILKPKPKIGASPTGEKVLDVRTSGYTADLF